MISKSNKSLYLIFMLIYGFSACVRAPGREVSSLATSRAESCEALLQLVRDTKAIVNDYSENINYDHGNDSNIGYNSNNISEVLSRWNNLGLFGCSHAAWEERLADASRRTGDPDLNHRLAAIEFYYSCAYWYSNKKGKRNTTLMNEFDTY